MKVTTTIVLATVLTAAAAPALAGEWIYHGGPKSPDSLTWYGHEDGYAAGPAYVVGPAGGFYGPAYPYRCDRAGSDCSYPGGW